jgi:hypothetical protein
MNGFRKEMNMEIEQGPICLHIGMYTLGLVSTGPLDNVMVGESGPVTDVIVG